MCSAACRKSFWFRCSDAQMWRWRTSKDMAGMMYGVPEAPGACIQTCNCNAGRLAILSLGSRQLHVLAAAGGRLQQRIKVVGGVRPIRQPPRPQQHEWHP